MTSTQRKKLIRQSESSRVEERRSAVWAMWKSDDPSFGPVILEALKKESLEDSSVWRSKCLMIAALGGLRYQPALTFLEGLVAEDFSKAPIIYSELAMALCLLKGLGPGNLKFMRTALKSKRPLFACGAYRAVYHLNFVLSDKEAIPLIRFAQEYSKRHRQDEQLTCMPRDFLAAAAYQWKGKAVRDFLLSCRASRYPHLREIAAASLAGKQSTDSRFNWYR